MINSHLLRFVCTININGDDPMGQRVLGTVFVMGFK